MTRLLFHKCWRESRWLLIGCTAAIFAFCWLRVWIVSRLSMDRFRAILEMLPGDWRRFLSIDFEWLITYPGRISLAYQELIVVLCVAVWSVARGSDAVSGEVHRGTMEMLLAQPFSRRKIMLVQNAIVLAGAAVLAASAWAGTAAGIYTTSVKEEVAPRLQLPLYLPGVGNSIPLPFGEKQIRRVPMHEKVDVMVFVPASVNLFSFGVLIAGFATLMSSWDRYRWRTIGVVTGTLIVQILFKAAGMGLEGMQWLNYFSVLSAYEPEVHVRIAATSPGESWHFVLFDAKGAWVGFSPLAHNLMLLGLGAVSFLLAGIIFTRRDLPAPL